MVTSYSDRSDRSIETSSSDVSWWVRADGIYVSCTGGKQKRAKKAAVSSGLKVSLAPSPSPSNLPGNQTLPHRAAGVDRRRCHCARLATKPRRDLLPHDRVVEPR